MSGLPNGWVKAKLGGLYSADGLFTDGDWIESKDQDPNGENRLLQLADIGDGVFIDKSSRFVNNEKFSALNCTAINEGDVLIARMPDPLGRACLAPKMPQRCLTVVDVAIFRTGKAGVLNKWLMNWINSPVVRAYIDVNSSGTTRKRISKGNLIAMELPVPPLPEQKRIADKLDATLARVDACRERLARVTPLLKRFRQSVLAAATSGQLTADWRKAQKQGYIDAGINQQGLYENTKVEMGSPANAKLDKSTNKWDSATNSIGLDVCSKKTSIELNTSDLIQASKRKWLLQNSSHNEAGRVEKRIAQFKSHIKGHEGLPFSWSWSALEDAVLLIVDCHNKTAPYEADGIPLVRTTNIRDGRFVWDDLRYVNQETYQYWSKRCVPEAGDLVFTREAPMGEVAIIPEGTKICLGQRTMLIRPVESVCSAKYIQSVIMDPNFKARSDSIAVGTGVKHYRVGDVSELLIPLPPVAEQTEIVRRVETLFAFADRLEARLANARQAADRLTPSLLAKAFRGELVPQDPNDEPASELLKRLATQREAAPKVKRSKKGTS